MVLVIVAMAALSAQARSQSLSYSGDFPDSVESTKLRRIGLDVRTSDAGNKDEELRL